MIKEFACYETELIFRGYFSKQFPVDIQKIARRKLKYLNRAADLTDLLVPPGNRLEKLKGKRAGQYSIRVNDQWRICFTWLVEGVLDVEMVDYHG